MCECECEWEIEINYSCAITFFFFYFYLFFFLSLSLNNMNAFQVSSFCAVNNHKSNSHNLIIVFARTLRLRQRPFKIEEQSSSCLDRSISRSDQLFNVKKWRKKKELYTNKVTISMTLLTFLLLLLFKMPVFFVVSVRMREK